MPPRKRRRKRKNQPKPQRDNLLKARLTSTKRFLLVPSHRPSRPVKPTSKEPILADPHEIRLLGRGSFKDGQTNPPTIALDDLYPNGGFPEGEIQQYQDKYVKSIVNSLLTLSVTCGEQQTLRNASTTA